MDKINIQGVLLTPLKIIHHYKGDIFHGMKKDDKGFAGFGEVYFSTIKGGQIKGWNRHKVMTLNLVVPKGEAIFVIHDDREDSSSKGDFYKVTLSPSNYQRLTVAPGLWVAFKGNYNKTSLILNVASIVHDPNEIDNLDLDHFDYNWESI